MSKVKNDPAAVITFNMMHGIKAADKLSSVQAAVISNQTLLAIKTSTMKDLSKPQAHGFTVAHTAANHNYPEFFNLIIIRCPLLINARNNCGRTPLTYANEIIIESLFKFYSTIIKYITVETIANIAQYCSESVIKCLFNQVFISDRTCVMTIIRLVFKTGCYYKVYLLLDILMPTAEEILASSLLYDTIADNQKNVFLRLIKLCDNPLVRVCGTSLRNSLSFIDDVVDKYNRRMAKHSTHVIEISPNRSCLI